jgi:ribosome biogenesis GTPase
MDEPGIDRPALGAWGWDPAWAATLEAVDADARPARVTSQHLGRWVVQTEDGPRPARMAAGTSSGPIPVTGDWVGCVPGPHESDPWSILAVLPRRAAVRRGAADDAGWEQVLAANVDRLWIVQALDTPPNLRSLERYLAVAWESGATPEIVLTKSDLARGLDDAVDQVRGIAFGVALWVVSATEAEGLDDLRASLSFGSTVALLGPSGAGKSTLVNRLAASDVARTGQVRAGDRKGRHTTTGRELFQIQGGALALDTPGMRELRVLALDEGLGQTFPDVQELAAGCRFRDCSHTSEPGCAVLQAVTEGRLGEDRLLSYRKLEAEAAYERRRVDPRARAERVAEHKTAMKTLRYHPKYQGEDG